eukprot:m.895975 g.895975  ORF g.895975 m.895975 type:complete len:1696 (+) comp23665_c0_seq2:202-5289(+)
MSLASILQARGSALAEPELWSLLAETAALIQCSTTASLSRFILSPFTLILGQTGTVSVQMAHHQSGSKSNVFMSSEHKLMTSSSDRLELERAHLYSLGITLYYAADYGAADHTHPELSPHLERLIASMVHEFSHKRCTLNDVVAACHGSPSTQGSTSHRHRISQLSSAAAKVWPATKRPSSAGLPQRLSDIPMTPSQDIASSTMGGGVGTWRASMSSPVAPQPGVRRRRSSGSLPVAGHVIVVLLDGRRMFHHTSADTLVRQVFDHAVTESGLKEHGFFGLSHMESDGLERFLPMNHPVSRYISSTSTAAKVLRFRVEFYVENINVLSLHHTRHLYYLQLKSDITSGYLFAEVNTALTLAAYAVQAELGDGNAAAPSGGEYFMLEQYVPEHVLASAPRGNLFQRIATLHRGLGGMSNTDAEREYCNEAQRLPDCGISFYPLVVGVRAGRRSSGALSAAGPQLFLGAGARGLFLYEGTATGKRQTDLRLGWRAIGEVVARGKKIKITEKKRDGGNVSTVTHAYTAASKDLATYIVNRIMSLHQFQKLIREQYPDTPAARLSIHADAADSMRRSNSGARISAGEVSTAGDSRASMVGSPSHRAARSSTATSALSSEENAPPPSSPAPPTEEAARDPAVVDTPTSLGGASRIRRSAPIEGAVHAFLDETATPAASDAGPKEPSGDGKVSVGISREAEQFCRDTLDPNGVREYDAPRCVVLERGDEPLGLTLVGAAAPGVFIMAIAAGKLADRDGRLQAKDRVLAINGHDTIHAQHQDAVALISVPGVVSLVVAARNPQAKRRRTGTGGNGDMREQARRAREAGAARRRQQQAGQPGATPLTEEPAGTDTGTAATPADDHHSSTADVGAVTLPVDGGTTAATHGRVERMVLTKGPEGIGMLLAGGQGTPFGATFIRAIVPGKAAARDGRLSVGDRVVEVDGRTLDGVSHHETVRIMQQSPKAIAITVQHLGQAQWDALVLAAEGQPDADGADVTPSPVAHSEAPPPASDGTRDTPVLRPPSSASVTSTEPMLISLQRSADGYGFKVTGGSDTHKKPYVREVIAGSVADQRGLRKGDRLAMINHRDITTATHDDICAAIADNKLGVVLHVRRKDSKQHKDVTVLIDCGPSGERPLGVKVNSVVAETGDVAVLIKSITPGHAFAASNNVYVGDQVLAINGKSLKNIDKTDLEQLLHTKAPTMVVQIRRRLAHDVQHTPVSPAPAPTDHTHPAAPTDGAHADAAPATAEVDSNDAAPHGGRKQSDPANASDMPRASPPPSPPPPPPPMSEAPDDLLDDVTASPPPLSADEGVLLQPTPVTTIGEEAEYIPPSPNKPPDVQGNPFAPSPVLEEEEEVTFSDSEDPLDDSSNPFAAQNVTADSLQLAGVTATTSNTDVGVDFGSVWMDLAEALGDAIAQDTPTREFREMHRLDYGLKFGTSRRNSVLNRYTDIHAHEDTRVRLETKPDGNDYINANHVVLDVNGFARREFILSQGPTKNTFKDFWRMVWENDCSGIVMVTGVVEMGRQKCHQYWPAKHQQEIKCDEFTVQNVELKEEDAFVTTFLRITNTTLRQARNVTHLRFKAWPDHGVPSSADPFLDFMSETENNTQRDKPLVVHCSAGIGRSGVFSIMLVAKEAVQEPDILANVKPPIPFDVVSLRDLTVMARKQRFMSVVQKPVQYVFMYQALVALLRRLKEDDDDTFA